MILFLDFETYYADDYTLRDMTPAEYILDPRFELIMCAVKENNGKPYIVEGTDFATWASGINWGRVTTVTHNALFDNCILAWRYKSVPRRVLCTMRLAAALRGHSLQSTSLAAVAASLGLGEKGTAITSVKALNREGIRAKGLWGSFTEYALKDVELCAGIFNRLIPELPASERRVMDLVLRCAVEPAFQVDKHMLKAHLDDLEVQRQELLASVKATPQELRSTGKFEKILKDRGIEIAYKPSQTDPEKKIPAFAKTDKFMADLLEHDDPDIQAFATARLGMRSTIEQKRAERIYKIASLDWPDYLRGNMPIPLRYSGAHTHRLSGDWKINMQNLPTGRGGKVSKLRKALKAPPGHKVVTADLAQIEARICAWICGQHDVVEMFRNGHDLYMEFAKVLFSDPWLNAKDNPVERFIGKTAVLGLGFGCGAEKFNNMVLQSARTLGLDFGSLIWSLPLAQKAVSTYRNKNWHIKNAWGTLSVFLGREWSSSGFPPTRFGPVEIGYGYVKGPNDLMMRYTVLPSFGGPRYKYGKSEHFIHGAKLLENIVQFLARIVIMNTALRLHDRGFTFKLQAHDELVFIVPDADIERAKEVIMCEMTRPPSWAKDLPLKAEIGVGESYGDAK